MKSFPVEAETEESAINRAKVEVQRNHKQYNRLVDSPEIDPDYKGLEPKDFLSDGSNPEREFTLDDYLTNSDDAAPAHRDLMLKRNPLR